MLFVIPTLRVVLSPVMDWIGSLTKFHPPGASTLSVYRTPLLGRTYTHPASPSTAKSPGARMAQSTLADLVLLYDQHFLVTDFVSIQPKLCHLLGMIRGKKTLANGKESF